MISHLRDHKRSQKAQEFNLELDEFRWTIECVKRYFQDFDTVLNACSVNKSKVMLKQRYTYIFTYTLNG